MRNLFLLLLLLVLRLYNNDIQSSIIDELPQAQPITLWRHERSVWIVRLPALAAAQPDIQATSIDPSSEHPTGRLADREAGAATRAWCWASLCAWEEDVSKLSPAQSSHPVFVHLTVRSSAAIFLEFFWVWASHRKHGSDGLASNEPNRLLKNSDRITDNDRAPVKARD